MVKFNVSNLTGQYLIKVRWNVLHIHSIEKLHRWKTRLSDSQYERLQSSTEIKLNESMAAS